MARRKIGTIRQVKKDIASYTYLMNGVAGIGKTTTVCEIGQKEFGIDGFLLLTIGQEPEPEHIGNLWNERAEDWDDLDDIIDTLCEYKKEDYPNLKMIGIDSVDEIFRLAESKVIDLHNKKVTNPTDKVDTIKKCFGGFQAGENKVVDLVANTVFKLRDCGYSLFFIGHTKQKNKKDLMTDIEFEQVTSNLDNKYYNCIKDKVNIVGCAYYERELTDLQTMKDAFSKKQKQVGKIASEKRVISFRDEEYALDVKSHLKYICDKCELDSDTIIKELKTAMKKQANIFGDKPIDNNIKVEEKPPVQGKKPINETKVKEEKIEKIKENLASLDMASLQKIMVKYKINNFEDAETIPMECLDEILELI
ncbi:TPA: AAA family ATPase [Clostridium botulinum]|nr:AAA family ATPase [Clostridium botulinum]HDK7206371.1 AAA family ATPase [Clostridium botulinum]HDK7210107.1 AAA family ATPase [Clostridium botulinum]HDK7265556.1 AAA family ATPase [Clostridium botulinum]HDK7269404.1 AAA family ATPase [Clostridium botulinum]